MIGLTVCRQKNVFPDANRRQSTDVDKGGRDDD
jgi:hypothetical protein